MLMARRFDGGPFLSDALETYFLCELASVFMIFPILTYLTFCSVVFFLFKTLSRRGERLEMFKRAFLSFLGLLFAVFGWGLTAL
jgi:threonine/homoserine/homoserine lactone efflux protein